MKRLVTAPHRTLRPALVAVAVLGCSGAGTLAQDVPATATAYSPAQTIPDLQIPAGTKDATLIEAERTLKGAELEKIKRDIELSAERQAEIAAEIDGLDKDQAMLNDQIVTTASRVQGLEQSLLDSEGRLGRLSDNESSIRLSLEGRRAVLAEVLAAAQRIGRRPPPALIVKPEDALGAVRSAIVLGAVLPEVRIEADALASDLAALVSVRVQAEAERDALKQSASRFAEEQERLSLLLDEKKRRSESQAAALEAEQARAAELASKAQSLEELMTALEENIASVRRAGTSAKQAAVTPRPAATDAGRLQPAVAFVDAKGKLTLPVRGVTIQNYGDDTGLGGAAQGISVATRADARVTAPCDGWVVYAGPFRSYGQLLILNAGDGYHVVLAGMSRIDVELGQFVLTGEPVGVMGSQRLASATAPDVNISQPVLYLEFRKDGASIDPAPWWVASLDRKVRG